MLGGRSGTITGKYGIYFYEASDQHHIVKPYLSKECPLIVTPNRAWSSFSIIVRNAWGIITCNGCVVYCIGWISGVTWVNLAMLLLCYTLCSIIWH